MEIGFVGLPNVGKSSLFNALTAAGVASENFPFTTIEPNVGVVPVNDERLDQLEKIYGAAKKIYAPVRFIDIAGLVPGASKGEGRGNKFLSDIRNVDAIAQVVRCFEDENVITVMEGINPRRDADVISTELLLADLQQVESLRDKIAGAAKAGVEGPKKQYELLSQIHAKLEQGIPVRKHGLPLDAIREFNFLSAKPILYVANVNENTKPASVAMVKEFALEQGAEMIELNNKLEADVMLMPEAERAEFREALGMKESGLSALARAGVKLLNLISFFAAGPKEVHAWHIAKGSPITKAAGKIHSDLERGFIRAEIFNFVDIASGGTEADLRAKGKIRMEGKDYITQDGDIVHIHFKV